MLINLINSNIDKDVLSYGRSPLELNTKGEVGLSEQKMDYYNGDDILFLNNVDAYQGDVAILSHFIYKKQILLSPGEHINIDLRLLLEDELSFFYSSGSLGKHSGFKLLLLNGVNIHDLREYRNLTGLGSSDLFIDPDNPEYTSLGIVRQIGFYEKDDLEYSLAKDIEILREKYVKKYNEVYVNQSDVDLRISFMIIARRPAVYNNGRTQGEKRLSFKLNVFSDSAKLVPFYYKQQDSIIPYLNYREEKGIISSITDISYLLKKRKLGKTETHIDNLIYGNTDDLVEIINLGNNEFSIENPLSKNNLQSKIVYYSFDTVASVGYVAYLYKSSVIVKMANPFMFYKIEVASVSQKISYKKAFISEDFKLHKVEDFSNLLVSDIPSITSYNSHISNELTSNKRTPHLSLICFSDLSEEKNIISIPLKNNIAILTLELSYSFGYMDSGSMVDLDLSDSYDEYDYLQVFNRRLLDDIGFFKIQLLVFNKDYLIKSIEMSKDINGDISSCKDSRYISMYKSFYSIPSSELSFLSEWNSDIRCELIISNRENTFFGKEIKPIIFNYISINGVKQK